jgi:hypothetical protein
MKTLALTICLLAASANAEFYTGNDLLTKLDATGADFAIAIGYISGVHDAARGTVHCSPQAVTAGQVVDMARKMLKAEPEIRNLSADVLVMAMMARAWPCAAKKAAPSI